MGDDIVLDVSFRFIVDDVSGGRAKEFRCSVYDSGDELVAESWGEDVQDSIVNSMREIEL